MRMVTVELGMRTVELGMGIGTGAGEETSAVEVAAAGERETIKMVTMAMSYNMDQKCSLVLSIGPLYILPLK